MVTIYRLLVIYIQPYEDIYENYNVFSMKGIVNVRPENSFKTCITDYARGSYYLSKNQVVKPLTPQKSTNLDQLESPLYYRSSERLFR